MSKYGYLMGFFLWVFLRRVFFFFLLTAVLWFVLKSDVSFKRFYSCRAVFHLSVSTGRDVLPTDAERG